VSSSTSVCARERATKGLPEGSPNIWYQSLKFRAVARGESAMSTVAARCDAVRAASVEAPEALRGGRGCVAAWRCCAAAENAAAQHNGHGAWPCRACGEAWLSGVEEKPFVGG
jgi:hypothetical protein